MSKPAKLVTSIVVLLLIVVVFAVPIPRDRSRAALIRNLRMTGPEGKATFQSCVFGAVQAGLLLRQALDQCQEDAARLAELAAGVNKLPDVPIQITPKQSETSATNVVASCKGGDPRVSSDGGSSGDDQSANYQDSNGNTYNCSGDVCTRTGLVDSSTAQNPTVWEKIVDFFTGGDDGGTERTAGDSACQEAINEANRVLSECNRTGWKNAECQSLNARMKGCPDPSLIYVDPDQGYACGQSVDPEAARQAFEDACNQLKRPGPDGSPCSPPRIEKSALDAVVEMDDICKNPYAYTDGEVCAVEVSIPADPDKKTWQAWLAWGLIHFGGPGTILTGPGPEPPPR